MDHSLALRELFQQADGDAGTPTAQEQGGPPTEAPPASDDKKRLEDLFGAPKRPPRTQGTGRPARDDGPWPEHNYNEAYHQITRHRPRPRRSQSADESTLWEISDLLDEQPEAKGPTPTVPPRTAAPTPWPEQRTLDLKLVQDALHGAPVPTTAGSTHDPEQWLDALTQDPPLPTTTEARLIGTLRGDADIVRQPLFDTTETLHARDGNDLPKTATEMTSTSSRTRGSLFAGPRALLLKLAGVALGLKVGISAGYLLATLL